MKYATVTNNTVYYYVRPMPTKQKAYREPILAGKRVCKWWLCAVARKWIYNII